VGLLRVAGRAGRVATERARKVALQAMFFAFVRPSKAPEASVGEVVACGRRESTAGGLNCQVTEDGYWFLPRPGRCKKMRSGDAGVVADCASDNLREFLWGETNDGRLSWTASLSLSARRSNSPKEPGRARQHRSRGRGIR